jgi:hypothetical protein
MKTSHLCSAVIFALSAFAFSQAQAQLPAPSSAKPPVLMQPSSSLEIMSEPSKVWKKLVSPEGLSAFGMAEAKGKSLEKVGDHAHATIAGDAGNIVVTHVAPGTEWRAAFEPDQGHYLCSVRFMLKPQGKGTLLEYGDWYTEEKPDMAEANLKEMKKSMDESLARFKLVAEKASAGK